MKYDKFMICIILLIAVITLIAIAAVFTTPANSVNANISATGIPTPIPSSVPGTPTPVASDLPGLPYETVTPAPRTDNITWFGSVQDSFGKPFGGINVTLHLMTTAGEAFNVTNVTAVDLPYPGTYVFDKIPLTPDITYAYAEASAGDLEEGVIYYGRSNNYTLNHSIMSSGFIVLHVPMPDQLNITVENPTISPINVAYVNTSGTGLPNSTLATAQLYLNGKPYKRSGTTITFLVDDEEVAFLPGVRTNITDETGRASILLTGSGEGKTNVTGYTKIGISRNLTDTCTVQVV